MIWMIGFALLFEVSMVCFGLELRDRIRARSMTPGYRYYWFPAVAMYATLILGAIFASVYIPIRIFLVFYFVGASVVAVPSAVALVSLLVYCPRVESRQGNLALRGLSIVLAVVIALVVHQVWKLVGIDKAFVEKPSVTTEQAAARV